jgi:HD-like signal output (HDOD) protein
VEDLPTLPHIVHEVLRAVEDEKVGALEMMNIMMRDQAITAKIIKLANSAYYARQSRVTELQQAIPVIGFDEVRRIAMSLVVAKCFPSRQNVAEFPMDKFWTHAMAVGDVARKFLHDESPQTQMLAYTSGLLHDIGKLIICQYYPQHFFLIVHYVQKFQLEMHDAETQILGGTHEHVGAILANLWKLPSPINTTIRHHHLQTYNLIQGDLGEKIVAAVNLADTIVRRVEIGFSGSRVIPEYDQDVISYQGVMLNDVVKMEKELEKEKSRYLSLFC